MLVSIAKKVRASVLSPDLIGERVHAAEILGDRQRRVETAIRGSREPGQLELLRREAVAGDAAPGLRAPDQRQRLIRGEPAAADHRSRLHRSLRGRHAQRGTRHVHLGGGHLLHLIRLDVPAGRRRAGRDAKLEPGPRQVGVWRLLVIQVTLAHVAGVHLDLVVAHRPGGAEAGDGTPPRVGRRHVADLLIVPIHDPRTIHRPPAETGDAELDGRADRAFGRVHLERLGHFDAALGEGHARIGDGDGVHAAVIFRHGETSRESPVRADRRPGQDLGALHEPLPPEAVAVFNDPAAVDRFPQQIHGPVRRQTVGGGVDLGADHRLVSVRARERQGLQPGARSCLGTPD